MCVLGEQGESLNERPALFFLSKLLEKGLSQLAHFVAQLDGRDDFHGS